MVRVLFLFIDKTGQYNENATFKLEDWDTFLELMKSELIDKEIEEEARPKLNSAYQLLSKIVKQIKEKNQEHMLK